MPLYGALRELLETIPQRSTSILTNTDGLPWKSGFSSTWNKAMKAMEEETLHFHDARGTFVTKIYGGDFSIREIAEMVAWSEEKVQRIIDRYVNQEALLRDKIRRLDAARASGSAET